MGHVRTGYLMGAILKEKEILKCKEVLAKKDKYHNDINMQIQGLYEERDELINSTMSLLESLLLPDICLEWTTIVWQDC